MKSQLFQLMLGKWDTILICLMNKGILAICGREGATSK
jgi:hypothetical protein